MTSSRTFRVADVAALAGVTVRTLHHYDAIGLLTPSARSRAGYRLYSEQDVLRLQQIVIQRELGLALEDIRRIFDDPNFDLRAALLEQRSALTRRIEECGAMLRSVDAALSRLELNARSPQTTPASPKDDIMQHLFEGFDASKHDREARERWGDTPAYAESKKRTSRYTEREWATFESEQRQVYEELAALLHSGTAASSDAAQAAAERHRRLIDRWFYPCSREHHRALASLYEADARFTESIDAAAPGLTSFLVAAIRSTAA